MQSGNDIFKIIGSISTILKFLKTASGVLPIKTTLLPSSRKNMKELQNRVTELDQIVKVGFPKLAQLVRSYSNLLSEVRGAKVFSDKMAELYSLAPNISQYNSILSPSI